MNNCMKKRFPRLKWVLLAEFFCILMLVAACFAFCENYSVPFGESMENTVLLHSGAYDVKIYYNVLGSPEQAGDEEGLGKVSFLTENSVILKANDVHLSGYDREAESRIWIRWGTEVTPVGIIISENEPGQLAVEKIEITGKPVYRIAVCLLTVCLFILLDAIYLFVGAEEICTREKRRFILLGIFCITFFSSMSFFAGSLLVGHDLEFHLSRILSLADALRERQIPNRMEFGMLNGEGYANPLYYGELFLVIPACLYNCYIPLQTCYQIYVVLVNLATACVSFWCFEKMTQDWKLGIFGAAVYTLSSYRVLGLLLRSSVGEYTAMIFLPLLSYGFWKIYNSQRGDRLLLSYMLPFIIAGTGIVNSHTLSVEMLLIFIIPFVLLHKKTYRKNILLCLIKSAVLTVLLNLWFLVPFFQSMGMDVKVTASQQIGKIEDTGNFLPQLFAVFHIGTWHAESGIDGNGGMTVSLGFVFVIGILLFFVVWIKKESWQLQQAEELYSAKLAFAAGCIGVFFSSRLFWWDNLEYISNRLARFLGKIQFSWRYLGIASLAFCIMLLFVMQIIQKHTEVWNYKILMLTLLLTLVFTEGYFMVDSTAVWEDGEKYYSASDVGAFKIGNGEYLLVNTERSGLYNRECICGTGVSDSGCRYESKGNYYLTCVNESDTGSYIDVPVQKYDNYHAYTEEGEELPLDTGENNRIRIGLPAYFDGMIRLRYQPPVLWRICEILSFVTLIGLTMAAWKKKKSVTNL
ncbi:MAG: YfhO family protein [Roseburia sp.]|nr:YfhO family protein [Roseburia sp.]